MDSLADSSVLQGARVLIVEDECLVADDLSSACKAAGGIIEGPFPCPKMAVAAVREAGCDVAILDIRLGESTAFAVAEVLLSKGIPFVFATGTDTNTIPPGMRRVPIWFKPFRTALLMQGLAIMLDLRRETTSHCSVPNRPITHASSWDGRTP